MYNLKKKKKLVSQLLFSRVFKTERQLTSLWAEEIISPRTFLSRLSFYAMLCLELNPFASMETLNSTPCFLHLMIYFKNKKTKTKTTFFQALACTGLCYTNLFIFFPKINIFSILFTATSKNFLLKRIEAHTCWKWSVCRQERMGIDFPYVQEIPRRSSNS